MLLFVKFSNRKCLSESLLKSVSFFVYSPMLFYNISQSATTGGLGTCVQPGFQTRTEEECKVRDCSGQTKLKVVLLIERWIDRLKIYVYMYIDILKDRYMYS